MIDHPIHFSEAEDMMSSRMDAPTAEKYEQIMKNWTPAARRRAFFSASVADATILSEIHNTVQRVVNGEMTQKQAARILRERFAGPDADALGRMGFMPKRYAQGIAELASIPRLNLIISTNVRMAQECGHFQQWERVKDMYPFGIWHCGFAEEHRPEHLVRDGKMYPFEHPIWRESPPGGEFNCHCWRENTTKAAADSRGLVPEDMASEFVPSSLGFDPSQPLDGDTVKPGKRVLPELAEKAKATQVPDDVLPDMDAQRRAEEEAKARRENALNDALEKRRREFSASAADYSNLDVSPLPDTIKDKEYVAKRRAPAAYKVAKIIPELYDRECLKYGNPPRICYDELCEKTLITPDGLELVIGRDIIHYPGKAMDILMKLDFIAKMKDGQKYRRGFAARQLKEAKLLNIKSKEITFITNAKIKENVRQEAITKTNPNFSTGQYKWTHNCQRVASAWEYRRRGFDVEAMPRISKYEQVDRWPYDSNWTEFYIGGRARLEFEYGKTSESLWKTSEEKIKSAGEGTRFIVAVQWKGRNAGGHVFNAEVRHGRVMYYDAQIGMKDCSVHWTGIKNTNVRLLRVDNLDFNTTLTEAAKKR